MHWRSASTEVVEHATRRTKPAPCRGGQARREPGQGEEAGSPRRSRRRAAARRDGEYGAGTDGAQGELPREGRRHHRRRQGGAYQLGGQGGRWLGWPPVLEWRNRRAGRCEWPPVPAWQSRQAEGRGWSSALKRRGRRAGGSWRALVPGGQSWRAVGQGWSPALEHQGRRLGWRGLRPRRDPSSTLNPAPAWAVALGIAQNALYSHLLFQGLASFFLSTCPRCVCPSSTQRRLVHAVLAISLFSFFYTLFLFFFVLIFFLLFIRG